MQLPCPTNAFKRGTTRAHAQDTHTDRQTHQSINNVRWRPTTLKREFRRIRGVWIGLQSNTKEVEILKKFYTRQLKVGCKWLRISREIA